MGKRGPVDILSSMVTAERTMEQTTRKERKRVIDFGCNCNIGNVLVLKRWYCYYHKQSVCYGWTHKKFKRIETTVKMVSTVLTITGAALSPLNLLTLVMAGLGVCIRTWSDARDFHGLTTKYQFAHTSYQGVADELRGYLRGLRYDKDILVSDMRVIDRMVSDTCPPLSEKVIRKYERTFIGP